METDEAIKISLAYQVCENALKSLLDTLSDTELNDLSTDKRRDIAWMQNRLLGVGGNLGAVRPEVRDIEHLLDAHDEEQIDKKVEAVQEILNIEGTLSTILTELTKTAPRVPTMEEIAEAAGLCNSDFKK